ncbi:flagellar assembly protein FliW [Planctomonas psychrotolerans]|uniref:flagellar assembly protein FliW n=1 Tax=Planctomonas psychrotolerans TaxID=2528712 RepID=UPI001D0D5FAB|nr:flagellar assembly protein FliW [Planctomonas psychrotolerans]
MSATPSALSALSASLTFVTPPPGLSPLVDFSLDEIVGADGLYALQAADDAATRLFVLDAGIHLPHYTPEITDEQCAALDVTAAEDAFVLVVANAGESGTTVNLMAPIVVNASTGMSAQFILDGQDWPLRAELTGRAA